MKISDRIREYITSHGITFKHVAEKSGINPKRFYRLLKGEARMSFEELEKICRDGLKVSPGIFFEENFSVNENGEI